MDNQPKPQQAPRPQRPGAQQPAAPKKDYGKDFRGILRIAGKEIRGEMNIDRGLSQIKGIGNNTAKIISRAIENQLGIPVKKLIGNLSDEEVAKIEELLKAPEKLFKKTYLLNRPMDTDTGIPRHLIGNDLMFATRQDIQFEKDTRTWRGWRHTMGQRVRGQHSRTTGRTGSSVGVLKKALKMQKAAAATSAQQDKGKDKK